MSRLRSVLILLLVGEVCFAQVGHPPVLRAVGQIMASGVSMDGVTVPNGTTLFSHSMIRTGPGPAAIRLSTGELIQLNANSAAYFEGMADGRLRVVLNSGTLSYRPVAGQTVTAASPDAVSFPQRRTGAVVPAINQQEGIVALLIASVQPGEVIVNVNDASRMNPEARTMIKTRAGEIHEVHYLKSIKKNVLTLKVPLKYAFQAEDLVIQGCECDEAVGAPEDGVVALLTTDAKKRMNKLTVRTLAFLDPEAKTLIKRKDGSIQEVQQIEEFSGDLVTLDGQLRYDYAEGDMLIQGCHVPPLGAGFWTWNKLALAGLGNGGTTAVVAGTGPEENPCSICQRVGSGVE